MDTPYIHIKFVPLVKTLVKSNLHYNIKIVPILSCVKSINKIKLQNVKDKVEYTIPITYRIVIMKDSPQKKCIRIYHSCVDIVASTSLLSVGLSAGDIPRSLSEYSILNKRNKCSEFENKATFNLNLNRKLNILDNTDYHLYEERKEMSRFKVSKSELKSLSYEKFNMLEKNIDSKVYKEIKCPKTSNVMQFDCNKININIYDYNNHQVLTNKIKCSESNINKSTGPKRESEKNLIKLGYNRNIEEKIKPTINMSTILAGNLLLNNFNDCCITNMTDIQVKMNHPKLFSSKLTNSYSRILPEVRVANFVQNMETEIRPLKIILNNIIKKCVESNFYTLLKCRSSVTKNTTKNCYTHSCDVEKYKTNRVVYSIVFHE